jgi:hypothetical protein
MRVCVFGMYVLCVLVMGKCLQYLRCLHMIMRIYVWTGVWNTYDEKCMYVVTFGLHMLERYVFIALAYMGKRMLMHSVVACPVWWSGEPTLVVRSDRESYEIFVEIDTWWSGEPRGAVIGRAHSNPCSDRESYGILLILLVGDGPTIPEFMHVKKTRLG